MSKIQGLPPLPQCFDGLITVQRTVSETSQGDVHEGVAHSFNIDINLKDDSGEEVFDMKIRNDNNSGNEKPSNSEGSPNAKLNFALKRLKSEMSGLRKLDVSLLCQLWTLHEAIQEYKNVMMDRYSDMGSEYSWGGLSSRASSITSIDSCDLNEDYILQSDPSIITSLQGSTTSLIQQIEELKVRAETEF